MLQLCEIWPIDISGTPDATLAKLGIRVEVKLHAFAAEQHTDVKGMISAGGSSQQWFVDQLASFVSTELGVDRPDPTLVNRTAEKVIENLAYREALI